MTEHQIHVAVAEYLALALQPPTYWSSIDHGAGRMTKAAAGLRKARGVKAGLPDIMVFHPGLVIGIELKAPNGALSRAQILAHMDMEKAGVRCYVARSLNNVEAILRSNEVPMRGRIQRAA